MSKERCKQAEEHLLRVRNVVDLASIIATDATESGWPGKLEGFLGRAQRHDSVAKLWELIKTTKHEDAALRLQNAGFYGVLMHVETPVRKYIAPEAESKIRSCGWSWCHVYLGWVYGETYDAAWEQAVAWARQRDSENFESALEAGQFF